MFKEWEVLYPKANMLLRCRCEGKKSEVSPVMQEAAKRVAGKSEVRSKSQTKEKQEEISEKLSSNCGGCKETDLVFWEAAGTAGKSKTAATRIKLRAHAPETTRTETSSNRRASTPSPLNGNLDQAGLEGP